MWCSFLCSDHHVYIVGIGIINLAVNWCLVLCTEITGPISVNSPPLDTFYRMMSLPLSLDISAPLVFVVHRGKGGGAEFTSDIVVDATEITRGGASLLRGKGIH